MILRRLTQHVKEQNWFAVTLDFLIVVAGIWVALLVGEWRSDLQKQGDLAKAERAINEEVLRSYFYAYERLAVAPSRKARYRLLGAKLIDKNQKWLGVPSVYGDGTLTKHRVFSPVLRSPYRPWLHLEWDTALSKGTLDVLDAERRTLLSDHYELVEYLNIAQAAITREEAGLQALTHPLELSVSDRLRYYDTLAKADVVASLFELNAEQLIENIEVNNLVTLNNQQRLFGQNWEGERNAARVRIYGDCAIQTEMPLYRNKPNSAVVK